MGEGWWGGAESLIKDQLKSHPFLADILAEAISMTHYKNHDLQKKTMIYRKSN